MSTDKNPATAAITAIIIIDDDDDDDDNKSSSSSSSKGQPPSNALAFLSEESFKSIQKDVMRCGRIIFPNENVTFPTTFDLPTFLRLFPPTKIVVPACSWIQVHNPNRKRRIMDCDHGKTNDDDTDNDNADTDNDDDDDNISVDLLVDIDIDDKNDKCRQRRKDMVEKEQQQQGETSHDVLMDFAKLGTQRVSAATKQKYRDRLFASAKDTHGKWMIFPNSKQVEAVWNAIATKVFHGELGCSAKVNNKAPAVSRCSTNVAASEEEAEGDGSTSRTDSNNNLKKKWYERKNDDEEEEEDDTYVICVYVDDFRNEEDVRRVLRGLLRIEGVTITAGFKPDFVTYLGLYADKARNPSYYPNAHKLGVTSIYKDMLRQEKELLTTEQECKEKGGISRQSNDDVIQMDKD